MATTDKGARAEDKRRVTLVLFSGGIDSTYVLAHLLRETDDIVLAHHLHLVTAAQRHLAEAAACRRIAAYLAAEVRPFVFTQSALDRHDLSDSGLDIMTAAFEGGFVASSYRAVKGRPVARWTLGYCAEELEALSTDPERQEDSARLAACMALACLDDPPAYFQLPVLSKRAQMDYIGADLTGFCWTCRMPVASGDGGFAPCGDCPTCQTMARITREGAA